MDRFGIEVINSLRELEIPPHIKGYEFIRAAMKLLSKNQALIYSITKELYPQTGELCGEHKASRVERGIRHSLEVGYDRAGKEKWHKVLGRPGRMTNSEFLATLNEVVSLKLAVETKIASAPTEALGKNLQTDCIIDPSKIEPFMDRTMAEEVLRRGER